MTVGDLNEVNKLVSRLTPLLKAQQDNLADLLDVLGDYQKYLQGELETTHEPWQEYPDHPKINDLPPEDDDPSIKVITLKAPF